MKCESTHVAVTELASAPRCRESLPTRRCVGKGGDTRFGLLERNWLKSLKRNQR